MKTLRLFLVVMSTTFITPCLGQQVVSSAGQYFGGSNLNVSFTLGEIAVASLTDGNLSLTQGMQQSGIGTVSVITSIEDELALRVRLFPNPAKEHINVSFENPGFLGQSYQLTDSQGQSIFHGLIRQNELSFDISGLAQGFYLLKLQGGNGRIYTYKFLKR